MAAVLFLSPLPFLPQPQPQPQPEDSPPAAEAQSPAESRRQDADVTLRVWNGQETVETTLAAYLPGVVRGEMPATFEPEALAAQAVAERTYICYHLRLGRKSAHPDADVCTDPSCCSAWMPEETARERWGEEYAAYQAKIDRAVEETDGKIILYDSEPILAAFHSSSAGRTVTSGEVWRTDLPYLRSVESPESGDSVPNYYSVTTVEAGDFRSAFCAAHPEADLTGEVTDWISAVRYSDSGRVEEAVVGGVAVAGTELRGIFSLRSACFTVAAEGDEVVFRVTGYGHGVGMSQYGADELARQGKTWQEILQWYYTGVTIGDMS